MASDKKETCSLQDSDIDNLSIDSNYIKPESRLQSLGFTIDNGKARFKLDDDTPAYSNAALGSFNVVDSDDTLSFVVLGKDSLDCIQASSLASYVDIHEKSMSIDYGSMITSWNLKEIQQKLKEVLHENNMLKETLKQNNVAMKKQFNSLSDWHEEIMKVHQNHKKKFAETRELINYLKKENAELKMKLTTGESNNIEMGYEILSANSLQNAVKEKGSSSSVKELEEKVSFLTAELNNSKLKCEKLTSDIEKLDSISNLMSSQLMEATSTIQEQRLNIKKLEVETSLSKSIDSTYFNRSLNSTTSQQSKPVNNCMECEQCSKKDKEINSLKESILALERKLEHITTPVQFCIKNSMNYKKHRQQYIQKVKNFNKKLRDFIFSSAKQIEHYIVANVYLNKITEMIEQIASGDNLSSTDLRFTSKNFVQKRGEYTEHLKHITGLQDELQRAFDDCESLMSDMDTVLSTNTDDSAVKKNDASESARNNEEEQEKLSLSKEREKLEGERNIFNEQKKNLELELKNLNDAKELLRQERMSLHEEKSSLDQQSNLYKSHYKKTLETEKNKFEAKYAKLVSEVSTLHESIEQKKLCIKELQSEVALHLENTNLLQTQLKLYEEDFNHEKKIKESLLDERNNMDTDLQKQIEFNITLQEEINRLKSQINGSASENQSNATQLVPPLVSTFLCPKCETVFRDMLSLENHIDHCLSLN
ncbi:uncharacterized protein LOC100880236 [Megachile rotundata]|uniref:uncharacterized protein LOC100880236 n=1 Tax=Megachile rotundata TaxID=143995 RepID=UPI003FD297E3